MLNISINPVKMAFTYFPSCSQSATCVKNWKHRKLIFPTVSNFDYNL